MNKLFAVAALLALMLALASVSQANPVSADDVAKYFKEQSDEGLKKISGVLDDLKGKGVEAKEALLDDDDDEEESVVKEKLIRFINKVDKLVKKMNPKKFYEEKVKKNKYYKFFFGDDEVLASD